MKTPFLCCFLALMLLPAACGGSFFSAEKVYREESKTLDSAKSDGIAISTRSGNIEVVGSREEKISVRMVRRAAGASRAQAESLLTSLRVLESKEGSLWKLQADFPATSSIEDVSIDFFVTIPARMSVQLEAHNGAVKTQGVEGRLQLRTHNGEAFVQGARDAVRVRSMNGAVRVEGDPSSIDLASHNGPIDVALASLRTFERESIVESHNGPIVFAAPAGFSANLHALCGNGSVSVAPAGRWDRSGTNEIRGALGTGGIRLRLESHNGTIAVKEKR